jgi:pimeloyl-ACP methyl ester carboxylesterase
VSEPAPPRRRRRGPRLLLVAVLVLLLLGGIGFAGAGWYYSGEIASGALEVHPLSETLEPDTVVEQVDGVRAVLRSTVTDSALGTDGTYGLVWDGGAGFVAGEAEPRDDGSVVRTFQVVDGTPPPPGTPADLRGDVWTDPRAAYLTDYDEVDIACDGGTCPAWFVPGDSSTWMVFVHGKGGSRTEPLRALGPAVTAGLPSLLITYRNDPEAPADPSGRYGQGATEWRDLEAAVRWAQEHGAEHVLLYGASMGGAIVASFLEQSELAGSVRGIVLDAPMLDLDATVEHGAAQRTLPVVGGVPDVLTATAEWMAGWRYDLDWDAVDHLPADWLDVPALVFHGTKDDLVPIATSDALAAEQPDLVTEVRVAGAGHVRAWNTDPLRYVEEMDAFVARAS